MLLAARAVLRDRGRVLGVAAAALLLAASMGLTVVVSERGSLAAVEEVLARTQPVIDLNIELGDSVADAQVERLLSLFREALTRELASRHAALSLVEGVVAAPWAPLGVVYKARCGSGFYAGPGGWAPYQPSYVPVRIRGENCVATAVPVAVFAPINKSSLGAYGLRVVEGRAPGPGEAMLEQRLVSLLSAPPGSTLNLWGVELRVSGVYRWRGGMRLAGVETHQLFPGIMVGDAGLIEELEAAARRAYEALPPGEARFVNTVLVWAPPPPDVIELQRPSGILPAPGNPVLYIGVLVDPAALAAIPMDEAYGALTALEDASINAASAVLSGPERGMGMSSDVGEVAASLQPWGNPLFLLALASTSLFMLGVGYYSALDAVAASAEEYRRLASLLAARGAPASLVRRGMLLGLLAPGAAAVLAASVASWALGGRVAALAAAVSLLVLLLALRRSVSSLAKALPVEAVRPVRASEALLESWEPGRRGRGLALLAGISLVPVLLGFSGVEPERLVEGLSGGAAAVAVLVIVLGLTFAPVAPALLGLYAGLALRWRRLYYALASRVAGLAASLSWAALASAERLAPPPGPAVLAAAVALGAGLAAASLPGLGSTGSWTVSRLLLVLSMFSAVSAVLLTAGLYAARYRLLRGEAAVLRARGAAAAQLLRFIYAVLVSGGLYVATAAAIPGLIIWLSFLGSARLFVTLQQGEAPVLPAPSPSGLLAYALMVVGLLLLPLFVARRLASERDIARLLREEGA